MEKQFTKGKIAAIIIFFAFLGIFLFASIVVGFEMNFFRYIELIVLGFFLWIGFIKKDNPKFPTYRLIFLGLFFIFFNGLVNDLFIKANLKWNIICSIIFISLFFLIKPKTS